MTSFPITTSFRITNGQLASIVSEILTNPFSGEVEGQEAFEKFCTDIAKVVTKYCGGEVIKGAEYQFGASSLDWTTHYMLEVEPNDSSPQGGGIWAKAEASVGMKQPRAGCKSLNETSQVVVFASEGMTRSVAIRDLPEGGEPCVVVDYDDMQGNPHQETGDFEREKIGCTREEFDRTATYIW